VTVHTEAWGLNQHSNHVATDFLVLLIHTFRMPIFFLVAGFFGALLFYERGQVKMSRNRVQRIVYNYTGAVFNGADSPLGVAAEFMAQPRYYLPSFTSHLWFLYYLALITFTTVVSDTGRPGNVDGGGFDFDCARLRDAPVPIMFALSSLIVWLFVFGITGLFLKHADGFSPRMRYVSDAAYWVYLIHLPFTALLPGLIDDWPLPALAKFFLVMSVTASICLSLPGQVYFHW